MHTIFKSICYIHISIYLQGRPLQCNALRLKIDSAETVQGGEFEDIQYKQAEN